MIVDIIWEDEYRETTLRVASDIDSLKKEEARKEERKGGRVESHSTGGEKREEGEWKRRKMKRIEE